MKRAFEYVHTNSLKVLGKRNKERKIPIGKELLSQIGEYIKLRNEMLKKDSVYLLVKNNGDKLYVKLVYSIVNKYMSMVSSLSKTSPHVLRHTFAST